MSVETPSLFAQAIQEHLELKQRNSDLEREMPLDVYKSEDPFENHPLFKTEEQARLEETMDGGSPPSPRQARGPARRRRRSRTPLASRPTGPRGQPLGSRVARLRLGRLAASLRVLAVLALWARRPGRRASRACQAARWGALLGACSSAVRPAALPADSNQR